MFAFRYFDIVLTFVTLGCNCGNDISPNRGTKPFKDHLVQSERAVTSFLHIIEY